MEVSRAQLARMGKAAQSASVPKAGEGRRKKSKREKARQIQQASCFLQQGNI